MGLESVMEEYKAWEASLGDAGKPCDFQPAYESALKKLEGKYSRMPTKLQVA